jgi:hypothetical protein
LYPTQTVQAFHQIHTPLAKRKAMALSDIPLLRYFPDISSLAFYQACFDPVPLSMTDKNASDQ